MTKTQRSITPSNQQRLLKLAAHRSRLEKEALNIFRPKPNQLKVFYSGASELLLRGGNRSGKSVCAAMLFASACTGIPIYDSDGNSLPIYGPHAFAHEQNRPMTMWTIGLGEKHIGQTLHRLLFQRGLFDMVKDLETDKWRAYDPETDQDRQADRRPSPPAIPKRLINPKGWGWKDKANRLFTKCELTNGTTIYAFTSVAYPKMGDPVDYIWIDEKIKFPGHYAEWQARISDHEGRIVWSVWPGHGSHVVVDLSKRAKDQQDRKKPDVEEVVLRFSDNPFIKEDEKRKRREGWSAEEIKSRDDGEFVFGASRVYPNFSEFVHRTPPASEGDYDAADKILAKNGGMPPTNWCRGLILDPGHSHPGVLLTAIAPPDVAEVCGGDVHVIYDEVYIPSCDAHTLAKHVLHKAKSQSFHYFVMDSHAGRTTPMGFSKTVREHYEDAFNLLSLRCVSTGGTFRMGSDDLMGGIEAVREALYIRRNGRPKLRLVTGNCPAFIKQMAMYRKEEHPSSGVTGEKPAGRQIDPLCDCIRYWCAGDFQYAPPPINAMPASPALEYFRSQWSPAPKQDRMSVTCGPGATTNEVSQR